MPARSVALSACAALVLLVVALAPLGPLSPLGQAGAAPSHPVAASSRVDTGSGHPATLTVAAADRPSASVPASPWIVSLAEPSDVLLDALARAQAGSGAGPAALDTAAEAVLAEWLAANPHGPDPDDHARLLRNEQRALAAGSSPRAMGLQVTGTLRLLVVAVEFAGSDTATISHPRSMTDRTCVTETLTFTGPLHGRIPPPGPRDNNTLWRPDFGVDHYESMLFGTAGITERVRLDLVDPEDGRPGIDVSGETLQGFYDEASGGLVRFEPGPAGTVAWVQVPHSEAWYGASRCSRGEAPDVAAMNGLPGNQGGAAQLVRDAATAINAAQPDFPWPEYDTDGDGVVDHLVVFHAGKDKSNGGGVQSWQAIWAHRGSANHVVYDGGTPDDRDDDIRTGGYTMQYEDAEPGVVIHEFGHDLGLPDLYDTSRGGANSTEYWDVMGAGSRTGKLNSTHPVMLSVWTRFALGWADPVVVTPTEGAVELRIGQASGAPAGTVDAARVNLPPTPVRQLAFPDESTQAWWSGNDQDWADVGLARDLSLVGVTAPITLSFDLNLQTERNWDFLFVEVSADGGRTFTQTKGFPVGSDEALTTPDDYADTNCILGPHPDRAQCAGRRNYGGLRYGYTGNSTSWPGDVGGWLRVWHDLSPYAGQAITLRLRYATDAGSLSRGAYVDNFEVRAGTRVVFADAVEGGEANDWVPSVGTFVPGTALGDGWRMHDGIFFVPKYYLVEWRNFDGFDRGLRYGYNMVFSALTEDGRSERQVDVVPMNVPGMLVWLRDVRYGSEPRGTNNSTIGASRIRAFPSEGPKGGVLVVDSHPAPMRGPRGGKLTPVDPETGRKYGPFPFPPLDNWTGRVQTSNAAFALADTPALTLTAAYKADNPATTVLTPTHYAPLPAAPAFHDAMGYYPGVEVLPEPIKVMSTSTTLRLKGYALADPDASVVVPARDYYAPRTPAGFTGQGVETSPPSADVSTEETIYNFDIDGEWLSIGTAGGTEVIGEHSGHPGSTNMQFGHHFRVIDQAADGSSGLVRFWNSRYEAEGTVEVSAPNTHDGGQVVVSSARNVGSPAHLLIYSDFDETHDLLDGDLPAGNVPVAVDEPTVRRIVTGAGPGLLEALRVPADRATAVVWWSAALLDTGERDGEAFQLYSRVDREAVRTPVVTAAAIPYVGVPVSVYLPRAASRAP